jgi:DNA polymerase-3 subunit epsilon
LNPRNGDRISEIGCIEIVQRRLTRRHFHFYINPEREIDAGALAIHGLTREFLSDKPKFHEVAPLLLDFIQDAELIIHNAQFDLDFLDAEFTLLGQPPFRKQCGNVIDTLIQARGLYPGKRNSLDALCERLGVSHAHRTLHGALLDSELLAEVYLAMTRGQEDLMMDMLVDAPSPTRVDTTHSAGLEPFELTVLHASADELTQHEAMLDELDKIANGSCVWRVA